MDEEAESLTGGKASEAKTYCKPPRTSSQSSLTQNMSEHTVNGTQRTCTPTISACPVLFAWHVLKSLATGFKKGPDRSSSVPVASDPGTCTHHGYSM